MCACPYDQLKALEGRTNAWDKRVNNARKARLQQEAELENKFELPPPPSSSSSGPSSPSSQQQSGPGPRVLSVEEMKAFELRNAQAQVGFNPYAAVISSSTEASTVMNSMSSASSQSALPPPAPMSAATPGRVTAPPSSQGYSESTSEGAGGVFVLLRQDPVMAITAAETIIKMLSNIQKNPEVNKSIGFDTGVENPIVMPSCVDLLVR